MNKWIGIGNLTRDPEYFPEIGANKTQLCKFTIAVNRPNSEQADFFPVAVFGKQAEPCSMYLGKGRKVAVEGRIQMEDYETEGVKRKSITVYASNVEFLDKRSEVTAGAGSAVHAEEDVPF